MGNYQEALKAFFDTLPCESGGGGVNTLQTLVPQDIAAVAIFLQDGRVAAFGGGEA